MNAQESASLAPEGHRLVRIYPTIVEGVRKLTFWNTGPGMDATELRTATNISASINKQMPLKGNFGIGAKVSGLTVGKYWPNEVASARRKRLFDVWQQIIELLDARIMGVAAALELPSSDARGHEMKAFEDKLDAVVCALVGACALDGTAVAHGDAESAIWVPKPL